MKKILEKVKGSSDTSLVMKTTTHLTELETKALEILFDSAKRNGHDFGFIENLTQSEIMGKEQFSGVLSSLVKKEILQEWGTWKINGITPRTQFTWGKSCGSGPNEWEARPKSFDDFCSIFNLVQNS